MTYNITRARTHTEYECNLCFLKVIEMKEGMKETGVMLDHELHIPDSLQSLNTAISPVLKHPLFLYWVTFCFVFSPKSSSGDR